jgi:hypothetical protein
MVMRFISNLPGSFEPLDQEATKAPVKAGQTRARLWPGLG